MGDNKFKSSGFWFAVLSHVVGLAVLFNLFSHDDATNQTVGDNINSAVQGVVALAANSVCFWKYGKSLISSHKKRRKRVANSRKRKSPDQSNSD